MPSQRGMAGAEQSRNAGYPAGDFDPRANFAEWPKMAVGAGRQFALMEGKRSRHASGKPLAAHNTEK